jgi:hypothetical protein
MSERRGGVRIEVCVLFMAAMFIAGMYTIGGCTQDGFYGIYEGVTNAIDQVVEEEEEQTTEGFKIKRRGSRLDDDDSCSYDDDDIYNNRCRSKVRDNDKDTSKPISIDKFFKRFFKSLKVFFTGTKISGFDNMGTQFRTTQFSSTVNPSEARIQDFFGGVKFSTKCCPSRYSTDTGCACLDQSKYDIIKTRAGNNMPFSQW